MHRVAVLVAGAAFALSSQAQDSKSREGNKPMVPAPAAPAIASALTLPADSVTEGTVTVGGQAIAYRAVAGMLTVGASNAQDAMLGLDGRLLPESGVEEPAKPEDRPATARMFYTAYFRKAPAGTVRPIMFAYNGGPGSSTMWLHMGSFGPRRVITSDAQHEGPAPYTLVENKYSLLDVSDIVFIDMPGAGFSRIFGKEKEKAFWGTDQDGAAFARFIRRFLTKYERWNSPKYLFGESYGTTRSAVLSHALQGVDLNGIVLLSSILSFDNSADGPGGNPGTDQAYALALPTFAATAFYKKLVPGQTGTLEAFLTEVESYALGEYLSALAQGSDLPEPRKRAVAEKLAAFTGLPAAYWLRANLRVAGGEFSKQLQLERGLTTGRLDTRYEGPDLNPLSASAEYDPQSAAISSAYGAAINQYVRETLKFGEQMTYKPSAYAEPGFNWDLKHRIPGGPEGFDASVNVMPDLAQTMKLNPRMKVLLTGGYFDAATTFFGATFEMKHLPIPQSLVGNISYRFYPAGHMIYVNEAVLAQFHDDVVSLVRGSAR